ncbi:acyl-CoA thioesterase [Alkalihalobacillus sp. 1P02AB]|uniref:acyl-CoA thioesterase n=1 Tax=Alkalihalobacillus sp. 1P02AB TaxID=3132260 RepID=UPI0039A4FE87
MFKTDIIVRFNDCDSLGHVNNATYFTYFEEGRTGLFQIFNPTLEISSWNLILASTKCDYLHEVVYGQQLTVYTWVSRLGNSSFDVEHAIQDEDKNWVARGKAILACYNFDNKKATPLTNEIREKLLNYQTAPSGAPELA